MKIVSIILMMSVALFMSGCIISQKPYLPLYQVEPEKTEIKK